MPMVGHDTISQQLDGMFLKCLEKDVLEGVVVAVFLEKGQAGNGPIEAMVNITASSGTGMAGHQDSLRRK